MKFESTPKDKTIEERLARKKYDKRSTLFFGAGKKTGNLGIKIANYVPYYIIIIRLDYDSCFIEASSNFLYFFVGGEGILLRAHIRRASPIIIVDLASSSSLDNNSSATNVIFCRDKVFP